MSFLSTQSPQHFSKQVTNLLLNSPSSPVSRGASFLKYEMTLFWPQTTLLLDVISPITLNSHSPLVCTTSFHPFPPTQLRSQINLRSWLFASLVTLRNFGITNCFLHAVMLGKNGLLLNSGCDSCKRQQCWERNRRSQGKQEMKYEMDRLYKGCHRPESRGLSRAAEDRVLWVARIARVARSWIWLTNRSQHTASDRA